MVHSGEHEVRTEIGVRDVHITLVFVHLNSRTVQPVTCDQYELQGWSGSTISHVALLTISKQTT